MAGLPLLGLLVSLGLSVAPPATPTEGALYADAPDGMYLLSDRWTGRADPRDRGQKAGWFREDRHGGFTPVTVPNAFNAGRRDARGFRAGIYWYRERFRLPDDPLASGWRLRFEGVGRRALVFLNGRFLGGVSGQYLASELPARGLVHGDNELVVRVDGRPRRSDIPPGDRPSGWWNYAGLVREVYLRRVSALEVSGLRVTAKRGQTAARVTVDADLHNTIRRPLAVPVASLQLESPDGTAHAAPTLHFSPLRLPAGGHAHARTSFSIPQARLWSPARPSLYALTLQLHAGPKATAHFGIRDWRLTRSGRVLLNGKPVRLRGANLHEQTPGRGSALTPLDRAQLADELASLGANFTRAHYPLHPALLDTFDRLGIVYWDEIPVWRMRGSQLTPSVRRRALAMLRRTIERDRNHPSVMAWGAENETLRGGAAARDYLRSAHALVQRLDPGRFLVAETPISPLDQIGRGLRAAGLIGFNEYLGWYSGLVNQVLPALARARALFPGKGIFVSEVGAEASRAGPATQKGTYAFQARFLARQFAAFSRAPRLNGILVWILRDFLVRPGWSGGDPRANPPLSTKGLLHQNGSPKPAFVTVRRAFGPRVAEAGSAR